MIHTLDKCTSIRWSVFLFLLSGLFAGCQSGSSVANSTGHFPQKTGFVQRTVVVDGVAKPVWVFVPPHYNPYRMYPAILFLHGLFEEGNGGTNVLSAGLGPIIARNPDQWPFITIFPQSNGTWQGTEREHLAMAALDDAEQNYMIDPDRIILAGLSYGGLGVWEIGARHRDRFAAFVPISGMRAPDLINDLTSTPVWAFASEGDPFVSHENSQIMCKAIDDHGGRAKLTEFPGMNHDCWAMAVDQSDLLSWMLVQHRNPLQTARASGGKSPISGHLRAFTE
ncbi:MAG TPA: prolyl oligopeptidase family serine peptidase [Tepidisphaeraceae bacterium]|nr:prolyl oligopeptidase family serine peptidase [Tepidisphaeraceae bacterium]